MSLVDMLRSELETLLLRVGPDAPTLCEGWTAFDLAVHLYIRENKLLTAAGMFVPALRPALERESHSLKAEGFESVVNKWATGRGARLPKRVRARMNTVEYFVHYADVALANGRQGIALSQEQRAELLSAARVLGAFLLRRSGGAVVFEPTGGKRIVVRDSLGVAARGDAVACVRGSAEALVLWLFGRDDSGVTVIDPLGLIRRSSL